MKKQTKEAFKMAIVRVGVLVVVAAAITIGLSYYEAGNITLAYGNQYLITRISFGKK